MHGASGSISAENAMPQDGQSNEDVNGNATAENAALLSSTQGVNGGTSAGNATPHDGQNNENGAARWKVSFVAGLMAGGTILRLLRAPIESRFGAPIFEAAFIQGTLATPLASLFSGLLVGIGTKVMIFLDLKLIDVIWGMYLGSHVVRNVEALFAFGRGNSNLLPYGSRNRAIPGSADFESLRREYTLQSHLGRFAPTPAPSLSLHHASDYHRQVVPICLFVLHRGPLCLWPCIGRYAPTVKSSRLPAPSL
jgi:hypothetical protein